MVELVLSFINPTLFKEYHRKTNAKEIVNESFDEELQESIGMSRAEAYKLAEQTEEQLPAETISSNEFDAVGQPIYVNDDNNG